MKLSQFRFDLPEELIAKYPAVHRDESRLLVVHRESDELEHTTFKNILDYFEEKDFFIFNDTKVFLQDCSDTRKNGAQIEVFLLRELNPDQHLWDVMVNPARKIRIGNKLYFGENEELVAEVIDNTTSRGRTLRFLYDGPYDSLKICFFGWRKHQSRNIWGGVLEPDEERFQTIFAANVVLL